MRVLIVSPPPLKPSEPGLSGAAAAQALRHLGLSAAYIDAAIGWQEFALKPPRLEAALDRLTRGGHGQRRIPAFRRAIAALRKSPPLLRRAETYASRNTYSSAVNDLGNALALAAADCPALKVGIANLTSDDNGARPESSTWLQSFSTAAGPFDAYFKEELIPAVRESGATHLGVSLTFKEQAPAGFRLARLLEEELPSCTRLLGGPYIACLDAVGARLDTLPFAAFHRVLRGSDLELLDLARELGAPAPSTAAPLGPWSVELDEVEWSRYLTPIPTVPVALSRGCYWRRCSFCPEHLHPGHTATTSAGLEAWLARIVQKFPEGAMLHLTDAAVPLDLLDRLASVIARDRLPIQWHGFVRVEPELADPAFALHLARGGCVMLQQGVESGSQRLLEKLGKGATPELARAVLRATAAAGIRNQVYLLFGVPTETDFDRELTLALVEGEAEHIHALNAAIMNLPRGSPMHRSPSRFGITEVRPFHSDTDLSLYDDFRCGDSHPRTEARRWLAHRFFKSAPVRQIGIELRSPLKANHLCFL